MKTPSKPISVIQVSECDESSPSIGNNEYSHTLLGHEGSFLDLNDRISIVDTDIENMQPRTLVMPESPQSEYE